MGIYITTNNQLFLFLFFFSTRKKESLGEAMRKLSNLYSGPHKATISTFKVFKIEKYESFIYAMAATMFVCVYKL